MNSPERGRDVALAEVLHMLVQRGWATNDPAGREKCCGMPRDEYGFCTYRPEHPVYVELP